jgi:hypothetical protein
MTTLVARGAHRANPAQRHDAPRVLHDGAEPVFNSRRESLGAAAIAD